MVVTKQYLIKAFPYLLSKLAGAGFLLFIILIYGVLLIGLDMYEIIEDISKLFIWAIALSFFTIFIDLFINKFAIKSKTLKILLYIIVGFVFFVPILIYVIFIWLAIWGSVMSLIIYLGSSISLRSKRFRYIFSIIIPILLLVLINIDFTEIKGWEEVKSSTSFEATFDYFNGHHEIPIHLEAGETLVYTMDYDNHNDGGIGFHMMNENNRRIGWKEIKTNEYQYVASEAGVYKIILTGDDVSGYFNVQWKIE